MPTRFPACTSVDDHARAWSSCPSRAGPGSRGTSRCRGLRRRVRRSPQQQVAHRPVAGRAASMPCSATHVPIRRSRPPDPRSRTGVAGMRSRGCGRSARLGSALQVEDAAGVVDAHDLAGTAAGCGVHRLCCPDRELVVLRRELVAVDRRLLHRVRPRRRRPGRRCTRGRREVVVAHRTRRRWKYVHHSGLASRRCQCKQVGEQSARRSLVLACVGAASASARRPFARVRSSSAARRRRREPAAGSGRTRPRPRPGAPRASRAGRSVRAAVVLVVAPRSRRASPGRALEPRPRRRRCCRRRP